MTREEKFKKVYKDFSSLPEDKQDYILGILQALVFAKNEGETIPAGNETKKLIREKENG